jgi:hypothetical protein
MRYLDYLESLDPAGSLLTRRPRRVLLWTGQSSWHHAGLFPDQHAGLNAICGEDALLSGFPFHRDCDQHRPSPLWLASLRNARQSFWCLSNSRYRRLLAAALGQAILQTSERLTLIATSCGLEMLNRAFAHVTVTSKCQLRIYALGPTCLASLALPRCIVIQGRRDVYSRLLFRGHVEHHVACGHLEYWRDPETLSLLRTLMAS